MASDEAPRLQLPAWRRRAARRGRRLTPACEETLRGLPALCEAMGVKMPRWAAELLEHAEVVGREMPIEVVEAITAPMVIAVAECRSLAARRWGRAMGVWAPMETPADAREWLLEGGYTTPEALAASMELTSFGQVVRALWRARNPPEPRCSRDELLRPFRPIRPGHEPVVVEDGTKGRVVFKLEDYEAGGPAWLVRGDRSELLFRGRWVQQRVAEAYALEHGHEFLGDG